MKTHHKLKKSSKGLK